MNFCKRGVKFIRYCLYKNLNLLHDFENYHETHNI